MVAVTSGASGNECFETRRIPDRCVVGGQGGCGGAGSGVDPDVFERDPVIQYRYPMASQATLLQLFFYLL